MDRFREWLRAAGIERRVRMIFGTLERAALLARRSVGTKPSTLKKWLNTPILDLDGEKPGDLLLTEPDVVVQWLEDAALGQPG